MENRVRRVYPRWEFITAPPTRRSPLAEGQTGLPNPCVAMEHHWFALLFSISFSSYLSCSVLLSIFDYHLYYIRQPAVCNLVLSSLAESFRCSVLCDIIHAIFIHSLWSQCLSLAIHPVISFVPVTLYVMSISFEQSYCVIFSVWLFLGVIYHLFCSLYRTLSCALLPIVNSAAVIGFDSKLSEEIFESPIHPPSGRYTLDPYKQYNTYNKYKP